MKKSFSISLILIFYLFVFPKPVRAFLPPDLLGIIASSGIPYLVGLLITILTQIIIITKKNKRWIKITLTIILLLTINFIGYKQYKKAAITKEINTLSWSDLNIADTEKWKKLIKHLEDTDEKDVIGLFDNPNMDTFLSDERAVILQEAIQNPNIKLLDIHCSETPVKGSIPACSLAWDIYENFDQPEEIEKIMFEQNLTKNDQIVAYCEAGYFSSLISYLLSMHGYQAQYAKLYDLEDPNLLEPFFGRSQNQIIIKNYEYQPNDKLSYFIINHSDQLIFSYGDDQYNHLKDQMWIYKVIDNIDLTPLEKQNPPHLMELVNEENKNQIIDSKIICQDKFHCFLVKNYLAYLNLDQEIENIYCLDCSKKRYSHTPAK